jgi:hypothetical protein
MESSPKHFPSVLAPIHGSSPTRVDLLLVHGSGLTFGAALLLAFGPNLSVLQSVCLFVLAWDMAGGMVANLTRSTNQWYDNQPAWVRVVFVVAHIYQPLLAMWAFPLANPFLFIGLYFFMLLNALPILRIEVADIQKPVAMGMLALGLLLFSLLPVGEPALAWFAPVYLTKLIYGFAVNHYARE